MSKKKIELKGQAEETRRNYLRPYFAALNIDVDSLNYSFVGIFNSKEKDLPSALSEKLYNTSRAELKAYGLNRVYKGGHKAAQDQQRGQWTADNVQLIKDKIGKIYEEKPASAPISTDNLVNQVEPQPVNIINNYGVLQIAPSYYPIPHLGFPSPLYGVNPILPAPAQFLNFLSSHNFYYGIPQSSLLASNVMYNIPATQQVQNIPFVAAPTTPGALPVDALPVESSGNKMKQLIYTYSISL